MALAHGLGIGVVAEGIETDDQRRRLLELGCDLGQGYLFSRPGRRPIEAARLLASRAVARTRRRGRSCRGQDASVSSGPPKRRSKNRNRLMKSR